MKVSSSLLLIGLTISLFACKSSTSRKLPEESDTVAGDLRADKKASAFDCRLLADKEFVHDIAQSVLEKRDNAEIWNLASVYAEEFFSVEDYFTNTTTKDRLVLMGGSAGGSAGNADNLLLLFSCTADTFRVVWAEQTGDIGENDIKDLNNDGIKEIVCHTSTMWMGVCSDHSSVFNFKNGKKNILYTAQSTSLIDCGSGEISDFYKKGDTLEHLVNYSFIKSDKGKYRIRQVQTTKIHNGGTTDEEVLKNLKVSVDTTAVELK